eukprot:scpid93659/ scgid20032/ 
MLTSFEFLMSLVVASNALASVRPLSVKLQQKSWDIVKAYDLVKETIQDLESVRGDEKTMDDWFDAASTWRRLLVQSLVCQGQQVVSCIAATSRPPHLRSTFGARSLHPS